MEWLWFVTVSGLFWLGHSLCLAQAKTMTHRGLLSLRFFVGVLEEGPWLGSSTGFQMELTSVPQKGTSVVSSYCPLRSDGLFPGDGQVCSMGVSQKNDSIEWKIPFPGRAPWSMPVPSPAKPWIQPHPMLLVGGHHSRLLKMIEQYEFSSLKSVVIIKPKPEKYSMTHASVGRTKSFQPLWRGIKQKLPNTCLHACKQQF